MNPFKVRKMGEKFNSLFGTNSKLYDQRTYKQLPDEKYLKMPNKKGFTSEEGRDTLSPCPFGFNQHLMNPREFQRLVIRRLHSENFCIFYPSESQGSVRITLKIILIDTKIATLSWGSRMGIQY